MPLVWGNGLKGRSYGFDAWADYQLTRWWRMGAGWSMLIERFHAKPSSSGLLGTSQLGDDPKQRASLRSSLTLAPTVSLDSELRYVSKLPDPYVRHYVELDSRLAWRLDGRIDLAVAGSNLIHKRHVEYAGADAVPRSVFVQLRWRP